MVDKTISADGARPPPPSLAPGKTTPRLYNDILTYNPYNKGINVLAHLPPRFDNGPGARKAPSTDYNRCHHQHSLVLKPKQSDKAPFRIEAGATQSVHSYCDHCRLHVHVEIKYAPDAALAHLCPTDKDPLHHFRYDARASGPTIEPSSLQEISGEKDVRVFRCSNGHCRTTATVTFRSRRITKHFHDLLTDQKVLWERNQKAFRDHPERFPEGRNNPTAAMVLKTLKQVISGVVDGKEAKRIPMLNTRFMTQLGAECMPIMETLGFTPDHQSEEVVPPDMSDLETNPEKQELLITLDDWYHEVMTLISEKDSLGTQYIPVRAETELKKLLGCSQYDRNVRRQVVDLTQPEHPMYGSLGATSDFSDTLLHWAYLRQVDVDPLNSPYYFECLTELARGRRSEELELQVTLLRSQGEFTATDLTDAYKYLGVPEDTKDEDFIVGTFQSRMTDAPKQEPVLREALGVIAKYRRSNKLQNAANRVVMSLGQAQVKLGIMQDTEDDMVLTMFNLGVAEKGDEKGHRQALRIVAEHRKSHKLLSFLETGEEHPRDVMTYAEAKAKLGVQDHVTDETLIAIFRLRVIDSPSQLNVLRSALRAFGEQRNSPQIRHFLLTGKDTLDKEAGGRNDHPVGLENTGNTCYLNSLLQCYFTIKPLRDLLIDYDQYQETGSTEVELAKKQVGGRKVSPAEIERAKRLAALFRDLFKDMITCPGQSVTPVKELSRLAMNPFTAEPKEPKKLGPELPPGGLQTDDGEYIPFSMDIDEKTSQRPQSSLLDDRASDTTLVGDEINPPPYEREGFVIIGDEKQEKQGQKQSDTVMVDDDDSVPLLSREGGDETMTDAPPPSSQNQKTSLPHPERPPPVPPRPNQLPVLGPVQRRVQSPLQLEENTFGKQQDVSECIENVMFQLEAALKADAYDSDGEQLDLIKRLFYGKTKQTLQLPGGNDNRTKEERFSHFLLDVGETGRDIYTALDYQFDATTVELEGKMARRFVSVTALPPVLQFQIQRVQFDRQKKVAFKSKAPLKYPDTIFMDRYLDAEDDPSLQKRREQSWVWKDQLEKLERRKAQLTATVGDSPISDQLDGIREYLEECNQEFGEDEDMIVVAPSLIVALEEHKDRIKNELEEIEVQIKELNSKIAQQFTDLRKYGYRIHSIFIHRGESVNFGHYWIYIYDFKKGIYRKYNDGYVTDVIDPTEMQDAGNTNPYFLVFVREDQTEYADAVCRDIGIPGPGEALEEAPVGFAGTSAAEAAPPGSLPTPVGTPTSEANEALRSRAPGGHLG